MATNNFRTQDNFPLFCTRYFDGYEYENEETGEIEFCESDYYAFEQAEKTIAEFNAELSYYRIRLESGYYAGVQIILEEQSNANGDIPLTAYYTPSEWKIYRASEKERYYGENYYFDMPYSLRVKAEQRERRKIEQYCRTVLKDYYDFDEYVCTARFSNGEALYGLASEQKNRIKALAV